MRNTIILLCLIMLLLAGNAFGQKFELIGGVGIGQCRMQDLRKFQDESCSSISLPAKITDDFPWTLHYSGELNVQLKNFYVGFAYFFLTTGSRISYSDYSGEIEMDLTAIAHGFGPSIKFPLYRTDKICVSSRTSVAAPLFAGNRKELYKNSGRNRDCLLYVIFMEYRSVSIH